MNYEVLDKRQVEFLADHGFTADTDLVECQRALFDREVDPCMSDLKRVLLDHAGVAAVLPPIDEDVQSIIGKGQCRSGEGVVLERMQPSRCHGNAARLWEMNRDENSIWTGYAMSGDGIWRQHSWVVRESDNRIVETTEPRLLYFGFRLSHRQAEMFADDND